MKTHRARVHSKIVILALDHSVANSHTVTLTDIESIDIVATIVITDCISSDAVQDQVVRLDAERLDRGVFDNEAGDG